MTMKMRVEHSRQAQDDLVGFADISDRMGVTLEAVAEWALRSEDFPSPVMILNRRTFPTYVYSLQDVRGWAARNVPTSERTE
jgi:hypothetical protein